MIFGLYGALIPTAQYLVDCGTLYAGTRTNSWRKAERNEEPQCLWQSTLLCPGPRRYPKLLLFFSNGVGITPREKRCADVEETPAPHRRPSRGPSFSWSQMAGRPLNNLISKSRVDLHNLLCNYNYLYNYRHNSTVYNYLSTTTSTTTYNGVVVWTLSPESGALILQLTSDHHPRLSSIDSKCFNADIIKY